MSADTKALAIIPKTLDESRTLATLLAKSSLVPPDLRGKEADVFVQVLAGLELGMAPMASIRNVHIIKGKPVMSADGMVALALGSGLAEYFLCVEESDTSATYATKRKGSPHEQRCTWTAEDAKRAGLMTNDNWRKYPRAMLKARCKAVLARDAYPDVLAGCYDPDEAREFSEPTPAPRPAPRKAPPPPEVIDAELVEEAPPELQRIEDASTLAELQALAPELKRLPDAIKARARAAYSARLEVLRAQEGAA